MKKPYLLTLYLSMLIVALLGFSSSFYAQTINVNPIGNPSSDLSLEELIDVELISSDCANISNLQAATGLTSGQANTKSFGFFTFNGDTRVFPISSGIILSTGEVSDLSSSGPNDRDQSTSGTTWNGDDDMKRILDNRLAGNFPTNDATSVQFEFQPLSNNISFNYVFASEEWESGQNAGFECPGSSVQDGFAFLIKGPGITPDPEFVGQPDEWKNIATFTDVFGQIQPVSVGTIYNNVDCSPNPRNPNLYISYAPFGTQAPIEYNARTVRLKAESIVQPGETYTIKLVIADRGDNQLDSAVFLEAGSFTGLGGNIPDFTVRSGNPACDQNEIVLDSGVANPNATFQWFKLPNLDPIPGENSSTLTVPSTGTYGGDGTYSVTISFGDVNCQTSDFAAVEFVRQPIIEVPPEDIILCETDGNGIEIFDLTLNNFIVGSQNDVQVEYFDPNGDLIPDPTAYTNMSPSDTITVRVSNSSNAEGFGTCPVEEIFTIAVLPQAQALPFNFRVCDNLDDGDDRNGFVTFVLSSIDNEVLGNQISTLFTVSYHSNPTDAETGNNPLSNLYTNTTANRQDIYARVQNNSNEDCYNTSIITLEVATLPSLVTSVDLRQCDTDTDGLSEFNLTEANSLISQNFLDETFTFYTSITDAENNTNAITNVLNYPNTDPSANSDVLYVRVENENSCFRIAQLELFVSTSQIPSTFVIPTYETCDDGQLDNNINDGITEFDFSDATAQIEALFPIGQSISINYYESVTDALAEVNAIPDISSHFNTTSPFNQTITYRVDNNTDNSCQGLGEFDLRVLNPRPRTEPDDIVLCDDVTVGDLSEVFDLTQNEAFIFDGNPSLRASYFLNFEDAISNNSTNEIEIASAYNNTNPTETIFVRVEDVTTSCFSIVDFDIRVNPLPEVIPVSSIIECENRTDGFFDFNIGQKRDEILNGQDSAEYVVTFHISQQDADDLTNPQSDLFTNTENPQEIFYTITNTVTDCSNSSGSFFVEILEGAQANPDDEPLDFELCDDNIENDGIAQFDLMLLESEILDGQDPEDYTISYHFSEQDAINNIEPLPLLYENLSNPQIIWVRVSNNISPDICFEVQEIPLKVNPLPQFNLDDIYVLCTTSNSTEVIPVPPIIDTGLSAANYSFEWSLNGVVLPSEISPILIPIEGGTYTVTVTDITTSTLTRCTSMDETIVLESQLPVIEVEVTSQAFADKHIVEVTTTNSGDFEFSLDNGPWQDSGIFEDVRPGIRTVSARDVNGCGITSSTVLVIDYPLYFTPNGDGNHDTWNIVGIDTQPRAKIYIFDRYGKLLKQLSPTSPGWDGTYRGNKMPTDDYWFTVEYMEPSTGETKQQSAHFTLKR